MTHLRSSSSGISSVIPLATGRDVYDYVAPDDYYEYEEYTDFSRTHSGTDQYADFPITVSSKSLVSLVSLVVSLVSLVSL